ncbi:autotransporter outer membrane beta-barrel domain-containing protein [Pseudomonas lini]
MNKVHSTIWNVSKGSWVVASEHVSARGKCSAGSSSKLAMAILLAGTVELTVLPSAVQAATSWNVASGNWLTAGNWSGGAPVTGTQTFITNGGTATLGVSSAATGATGQLVVGHTAAGTLIVQNGSTLSSSAEALFGNVSGSTGTVTITGGSTWANTGRIEVGRNGTATLTISGASSVTSTSNVLVGSGTGGSGTVIVTGSGSSLTETGGVMVVGHFGTGTLSILNGGEVNTGGMLQVGNVAGVTGTINVDGSGSTLTAGSTIIVGDSGTGIVAVSNGGAVSGLTTILGNSSTGVGAVTVDGSGSTWAATGALVVGQSGKGTLTITNGADVSTTGAIQIGNATSTSSGTVQVDGSGSTLTTGDAIYVGSTGTGTLSITNGADVTATGGAIIGNASTGKGTLTVDGSGSTLTSTSGWIFVGNSGTGTLSITDGGAVTGTYVLIGNASTGSGTVTVDGSSSILTGSATLVVGQSGSGTLAITDGGTASFANIQVGNATSTSSGTVLVDGNGSTLTASENFYVGLAGPGAVTVSNDAAVVVGGVLAVAAASSTGSVAVTTGGTVAAAAVNIGVSSNPAASGTMTVDGSGSTLTSAGDITVGYTATGTLEIFNGATTTAEKIIGGAVFGVATITVDGGGSLLSTDVLSLGESLATATMTVSDGASVTVVGSSLVTDPSAIIGNGGAATVTVSDATLAVTGEIQVGRTYGDGASGTLTIENAGTVRADSLSIAVDAGETGAVATSSATGATGTVLVTGTGSALAISGTVIVAEDNYDTGTLSVTDSGLAMAKGGVIVAAETGSTGTVNITDLGELQTLALTGGSGTAQVNFDNGTLTALADNSAFVSGFSGTQLNIASGGLSMDSAGFTVTASSPFTGVGALTSEGSGTLILTGDSIYTGGTTISAGTLQLGNGGTSGSIIGDVTDNGMLTFNRSDVHAFDGVISGSGKVIQLGSGTTVLTADNTYTGGTTIAAGTLQLGNGGTSGSILGDITDNGTLTFNRSDVSTFDGTISGTGNVTQIGSGTTVLTADNTYTGGTTIAAGTLQLGNGGISGSIIGDVTDNGTLTFNRSDVSTFDGTISGSGNVTQIGSGTTVLTADNTYTGGTTIATGTLQLGNGGTTGSILGDVTDNGTLTFNRSDVSTFDGTISGSGNVTQIGSGTTVLTADNTYTGGTTIATGTLQLGNGGTTGSILGDVTDNGTLTFNRSDVYTFAGTVSGSGNLTQIGSGTTVLTGVSTYTGTTTVSAGTLAVGNAANRSAALTGGGANYVASGATLGGYGSVTGTVTNDGTVAVANAISAFTSEANGTFTLNGTLINNALAQVGGSGVGNTLMVNNYVGNSGTLALNTYLGTDGSPSDLLAINGGTTTGTSSLLISNVGGAGALTVGNGILVVDALNGATTSASAFTLGSRVIAGPYEYTLYRGAKDGSSTEDWYLRSTAWLSNGQQVANYRQEVSLYSTLPSMTQVYGRELLGTLHQRVGEQEQLSGGSAFNPSGDDTANGVWGRVINVRGKQGDGNLYGNGAQFDYKLSALQLGVDLYRHQDDEGSRDHLGVYGSIGRLNGNVEHYTGERAGSNSFDAYSLGAYATHYGASGWYVDSVLQGTWYENVKAKSSRNLMASSPVAVGLESKGFGVAASVEVGYPLELTDHWILEPQAQVVYQRVELNNASDVAATVRFAPATSMAERIGARLTTTRELDRGVESRQITPWVTANLWHESRGDNRTEMSSEEGFVPFHSKMGGSWAEVGAGVTGQITRNTSVYAHASHEFGFDGDRQANAYAVGVRVNW